MTIHRNHRLIASHGEAARSHRTLGALTVLCMVLLRTSLAYAQTFQCPGPIDLAKDKLPEIVSDHGVLRGVLVLRDEQQAFQIGTDNSGAGKCVSQLLRFYQKNEPAAPPDPKRAAAPQPGPTLRAKLGDVVELTFLNQIDPLDYGNSIDRWENLTGDPNVPGAGCDSSTAGYPNLGNDSAGKPVIDSMPNCFHGSSTGNLHFHGTHTSPSSTADDVFIGVRPSPRENGKPTVTEASVRRDFDTFFDKCEKALKADNLAEWPKVWADLPQTWTDAQEKLLKAYDQGRLPQTQLWPVNAAQIAAGEWPQYYIGAFPNCFVLPKYPGVVPHHEGMAMGLRMGQSPGTMWYHAHKHGSTALNVSNGMAGAFIIEGDEYDGKLNAFYNQYRTDKTTDWTRQQPTLVVNQLGTTPGLERGGGAGRPPFSVNGEQQPAMTMYPGEVKLWRIVNASSASGFYLPSTGIPGFAWRQTAQDGVQFDDQNYQARAQRGVFVAPGNRIDLLVRAPSGGPMPLSTPVSVNEGVSVSVAEASKKPVTLLTIALAGTGPAMPLLPHMPLRPGFLHDIADSEVCATCKRQVVFETTGPGGQREHTINGKKFSEGKPLTIEHLNTVEEWKVVNKTVAPKVDHPFHIHINPFQVVEVFDPNAQIQVNGKPVPLYVVQTTKPTLLTGQCWVNPDDEATWKNCNTPAANKTNIWWDVFPIPAGINAKATSAPVVIPGYFRMRSRFVDYAGSYVLHCHILAHEDRGMMLQVNLAVTEKVPRQHH